MRGKVVVFVLKIPWHKSGLVACLSFSVPCLLACLLTIIIFYFYFGGLLLSRRVSITFKLLFSFCQDLTAISVTKTGHRKKILSESAKLERTTVFPKEKPVSY